MIVLKSSQDLGLVKIMVFGVNITFKNVNADPEQAVRENVTSDPVLSPFADVFQGVGSLPEEYSIQRDKAVRPVVHPPRRVPCLRRKQ